MKKLLPYAHPVALIVVMVVQSLALILVGGGKVLPALAQWDTPTQLTYGLAVLSAVIVLGGWGLYFLVLTGLVLATRGPSSIAVAPRSSCRSLSLWLCHRWSFFSNGGQQAGFRICGVEVALQGQLRH